MSDRSSDEVSLATIKGGAAVEKFNHALSQVLENIDDPNTDADAERSISLVVKMKPSPDRAEVAYTIQVKPKFAPPTADGGLMYVGRRHGGLVAVDFNPQQPDMFDPDRGVDIQPLRAASSSVEEGDG